MTSEMNLPAASRALLLVVGFLSISKNVSPAPMREAPANTLVAGGVLTGSVVCSDTQGPARFAEVRVIRKLTGEQMKIANLTAADPAPKGSDPAIGSVTAWAETVTDSNGHYRVTDLPPGDYFVLVAAAGYLTPLNTPVTLGSDTQVVDQNKMLQRLPLIHLEAGGEAVVNLSLQKGGIVSGVVRYEDGSAAAGIQMMAVPASEESNARETPEIWAVPSERYSAVSQKTDDQGHYRLSGLPKGRYRIKAVFRVERQEQYTLSQEEVRDIAHSDQQIRVYAPNTQRLNEAEIVELKSGERHEGVDLELDLSGLHAVFGSLAAPDHHVIAGAEVILSQGDGKDFFRVVTTDIKGRFRLDYVPAGTYTLTLDEISDRLPVSNDDQEEIAARYQKIVKTIIVEASETDLGTLQAIPMKSSDAGNQAERQ